MLLSDNQQRIFFFLIPLPQQRKKEVYDLNCLKMFYVSLGLVKLLIQTQLLLNL